jgi:hypothetical protein
MFEAETTLRVGEKPCDANHFSLGSVDKCPECATGFSKPGSVACTPCAPGTVYNSSVSNCVDCPVGTSAPFEASNCTVCEAGTVASTNASATCVVCPAGTKAVDGIRCDECAEGTYSKGYVNKCEPCGVRRYNNAKSADACEFCPEFETTLEEGATKCVCEQDTFNATEPTSEGRWCIPCSEGMDCAEAGNDITELKLKDENWRPSDTSSEVLACPVEKACRSSSFSAMMINSTTNTTEVDEFGCVEGWSIRTSW